VYKRGQAGITKASVTIVFNNEDRANSPLGYEECKTISITRQVYIPINFFFLFFTFFIFTFIFYILNNYLLLN